MMSADRLPQHRRIPVTKFDRKRGWLWFDNKRYPVPTAEFLLLPVLPDYSVNAPDK